MRRAPFCYFFLINNFLPNMPSVKSIYLPLHFNTWLYNLTVHIRKKEIFSIQGERENLEENKKQYLKKKKLGMKIMKERETE